MTVFEFPGSTLIVPVIRPENDFQSFLLEICIVVHSWLAFRCREIYPGSIRIVPVIRPGNDPQSSLLEIWIILYSRIGFSCRFSVTENVSGVDSDRSRYKARERFSVFPARDLKNLMWGGVNFWSCSIIFRSGFDYRGMDW